MNVLLAYCNDPSLDTEYHTRLMPVGLPLMAALLRREGHDARVANFSGVDKVGVEKVLRTFRPSLLGVSQLTHNRHQALELAALAREILPDTLVVFGGPHATFCHEELLRRNSCIDLVVLGEGEETILELVRARLTGQPLAFPIAGVAGRFGGEVLAGPPRDAVLSMDDLPLTVDGLAHAFHVDPRRQGEFVITSRGCPARCSFCSSPSFWSGGIRFRSAESMLAEVEALRDRYGLLYLSIRDDTFTTDRQRVIEFCKGLLERRLFILWNCQSRVGAVDQELLLWMRRAGCECIQFGVESGSASILKALGKGSSIEQVVTACRLVREAGMTLALYLISGVPGETAADIDATLNLLRQIRPHEVQVAPLAYYPGTRLFSAAVQEGRVPADLFTAEQASGLYVCSGSQPEKHHARLVAAAKQLGRKNGYTAYDYEAQRRLVGYSHAGNLMAGEYWQECGEMERAEASYREMVARQPDNALGWLALGELLGSDGRIKEAGNALSRVIALVPNHAPAYTLLGELALISGQRREAERWFSVALDLDPHDSVAAAFFQPPQGGGSRKKKGAKH